MNSFRWKSGIMEKWNNEKIEEKMEDWKRWNKGNRGNNGKKKTINRGFKQSLPVNECYLVVQAGIIPILLASLMRSIALLSKLQYSNIPTFQYSKITIFYP